MGYKNVQHYRHTVHRYLDGIWLMSSKKKSARRTMYKLLSTKMNLDIDDTHIALFTREQCKQAITILRPMYIQLFHHDLIIEEECKMFYVQREFDAVAEVAFDNAIVKKFVLSITIYCKRKALNSDNEVLDLDDTQQKILSLIEHNILNDVIKTKPTLCTVAKFICDEIVSCYKVKVTKGRDEAVYEEDVS